MKRPAEFLIQKRDGRREYLRTTKLARSILLALDVTGESEEWQAIELASTVLTGLGHQRQANGEGLLLSTEQIAEAVLKVLVATGFGAAAARFVESRAEQRRRRRLLSGRQALLAGGDSGASGLGVEGAPPWFGVSPADGPNEDYEAFRCHEN